MPVLNSHRAPNWSSFIPPAAVLCGALIFSVINQASPTTAEIVLKVLLRFLRFALLLCIPLLVLPRFYAFILTKRRDSFLMVNVPGTSGIELGRLWFFRPFQGIGTGLLFATKLLVVLQLVAGPAVPSSLLIPQGYFQLGRLLMVTLITVIVSLILSTIWSLDDLGIRYYNRRDQELKMVGKYVGTVMPLIFGFYGVANLLVTYSAWETFVFLCKIAVVLYPPMTVFALLHAYFLVSKPHLFTRVPVARGGIGHEEQGKE